jgi:hypothetical protein
MMAGFIEKSRQLVASGAIVQNVDNALESRSSTSGAS